MAPKYQRAGMINWIEVGAEVVAMTLFVYIGCGSAALANVAGQTPTVMPTVAMAFGLAIMALAYATAHTSGGQINCAVTFALALLGQRTWPQAVANVLGQLLGSVLGALFLYATFTDMADHGLYLFGANYIPINIASDVNAQCTKAGVVDMNCPGFSKPMISVGGVFFAEMLMTFVLCFVVSEIAINEKSIAKNTAPIAIGWTVFLAHAVNIPITTCGINPTRTFGPMILAIAVGSDNPDVQKIKDHSWIYFVAPMVGALVAGLVCKFIFRSDRQTRDSVLDSNDLQAALSGDYQQSVN